MFILGKPGGKNEKQTVWNGIVSFSLIKKHLQADKCYAWSSPIEGSAKQRYYAVLNIPPAVHDHKAEKLK